MSTDSEIITRSFDDPRAFAEIFERHARAILGYASKRVGRDAADDVLSETFLVAFRKRRRFDMSRTGARPWLFGIATRIIQQRSRDAARQLRAFEAAAAQGDVTLHATENVLDRLAAEETLRRLGPRLHELPKRDLETLLLSGLAGLEHAEVAEALGIPVGTVKSRLNRARARLDPPGERERQTELSHQKG